MTLPGEIIAREPKWLHEPAPCSNVVATSRARFARNVDGQQFAPHAAPSVLEEVHDEILEALRRSEYVRPFFLLELTEVTGTERAFLMERRLISREMERGGANRTVYVGPQLKSSILVNEEDHLRLQCLENGLQLPAVMGALEKLDNEVGEVIPYAYHERYGYLTACPTNVGTALRASVMMHLPGLSIRNEIQSNLQPLPRQGLTVRGFHGENSENSGDYFQISNEVSLGKSKEQIVEELSEVVTHLMEKELEARSVLHRENGLAIQDAVWRSFGILTHARRLDTSEAMRLLSRLRLGIDEGYFKNLSHETLNLLAMEIQPAHLMFRHGGDAEGSEARDQARARLIRERLHEAESE